MSPTTYFDHELDGIDKPITNAIRTALGVSGLLMLIIGLVFLVWPVKSAEFIAGIIALYAALAGLVNLAIGVFSSKLGGWVRFGHLALGALFLLAGIMSFTNLGAAALGLAVTLAFIVGITWIAEAVISLTTVGDSPSKTWTIIYAVISFIAGLSMLFSPLGGVAILWIFLGVSLVVMGIAQLVRAFRFGS